MVTFPNCKINLGLHVLRKRADGFHDLETLFYPLPFTDVLEIVPADQGLTLHLSGFPVAGANDNLCIKAWQLVQKDFLSLPDVNIHLHKAIPSGAGLGGGSADAAFTLRMLNEMFELSISDAQLQHYALELGSDCPFFLLNKPCVASGRGEVLDEIIFSLKGYSIVLVNPHIHVSTREAFQSIQPTMPSCSIKEIISQPLSTWRDGLLNDFEEPVFLMHPELKQIKQQLYEDGAVYASMSGSGSTVFGIFDSGRPLPEPQKYFSKAFKL